MADQDVDALAAQIRASPIALHNALQPLDVLPIARFVQTEVGANAQLIGGGQLPNLIPVQRHSRIAREQTNKDEYEQADDQ
ncbi:hypothetical protein J6TS7_58350 [Paenibacillus dendritiformis]|nr:hypothetical protein J6TS7_58350 [Paenibacillus dendritiformis]